MRRAEIRRKFDEIVAFSEVEKFLDTPVKRYSSGMYVRLAFAVAAHLEPEILIVDEVLAVGDAAFQKKCLGKMGDVAHSGRTVLFVSHNMSAVEALCGHAIYLRSGVVKAAGDVKGVIQSYLKDASDAYTPRLAEGLEIGPCLKLVSLELTPNPVQSGERCDFSILFYARKNTTLNELSLLIDSASGSRVSLVDLRGGGLPTVVSTGETLQIKGTVIAVPYVEGDYSFGMNVNTPEYWENIFELARLSVTGRVLKSGYAQYPAMYRGTTELQVRASVEIVQKL
jgi:lipopolysaccharide transport system ATP-binding protein